MGQRRAWLAKNMAEQVQRAVKQATTSIMEGTIDRRHRGFG